MLARFYDFVRQNPEVAQIVIDKSQDQTIINRFIEILTERYTELFAKLEIREHDVLVPSDFVISYITSILAGTLKWWVSSPSTMKASDFAHLIVKLISNGHLTVLGVNIKS